VNFSHIPKFEILGRDSLELLISLVLLNLDVVDVALGSDQLVLGILQLGVGVIEEVRLYIAVVVGPHQLVV
jgi:hypothetical protein